MKKTAGWYLVLLANDTYLSGVYETITGRRVVQGTTDLIHACVYRTKQGANGAIKKYRLEGAAVVSESDAWAGRV